MQTSSSEFLTVEHKKAGRIPVRHTCRSRQEPALKTTEIRPARLEDTIVLAGVFRFRAKMFETWRVYMCFCRNNRWNELGNGFLKGRNAIPKHNLHANEEKSNVFSAFFNLFLSFEGESMDALRPASLGAAAPPW